MAIVRKTVTLTEQQAQWLMANVEAGLFANISEHIRDLIRRAQESVQESQEEIEAIRQKLIEAEQSPIVPFDPEEFKKEMKAKYGR